MAYQTGTTGINTIEELCTTLSTFLTGLVGPGWSLDELDTGNNRMYITLSGGLSVGFAWNDTKTDRMWMQHQVGVTTGSDFGSQPLHANQNAVSDPGAGIGSADLNARLVYFRDNPPFVRYHFFASEVAPYYCHVVIEMAGNIFRHFGFGELIKFNDFAGGEYVYTHNLNDASRHQAHDNTSSSVGLDGTASFYRRAWSLRVPDFLPGGDPTQVFAVAQTASSAIGFNDSSGGNVIRARCYGGWRGGGHVTELGNVPQSNFDSMRMLFPVDVFLEDETTLSGKPIYYAGRQKDVRTLNIGNFLPGDEITIGPDTWVIFPTTRKQVSANIGEGDASRNQGVAFLKNAA